MTVRLYLVYASCYVFANHVYYIGTAPHLVTTIINYMEGEGSSVVNILARAPFCYRFNFVPEVMYVNGPPCRIYVPGLVAVWNNLLLFRLHLMPSLLLG